MAQLVIESFSNGLDLRKAQDAAVPGSLRVLNNAYVNSGGNIEKRRAYVKEAQLSAYARSADYRGCVTGPHPVNGLADVVYFRHRHNSLPGGALWATGAGSMAKSILLGGGEAMAWAMKSTIAPPDFGGLIRAQSFSQFANNTHLFEAWVNNLNAGYRAQHIEVEHGSDGEPLVETAITANANRRFQMTHRSKGYVAGGANTLLASQVMDPGEMTGTGSGSVDLRTQGVSIGTLQALAEYFGQLVVFGRQGAQFWQVDADFAQNQYLRMVPLMLLAPRSVTPFIGGDLIYLSTTGVRSLRAQDSSNAARVSDVGSPIDQIMTDVREGGALEGISEWAPALLRMTTDFMNLAVGVVHPTNGQFWLCLADKIYVLSVHDDAKVRAWSTFDLPAPAGNPDTLKYRWVADICPIRDTLMFRTFNDEIFTYSGTAGLNTWDDTVAEVVTPYMDMGRPSAKKQLHGLDISCTGTWSVEVSTDMKNEAWAPLGQITGSSHRLWDQIPFEMEVTHFSLRLRSIGAGAATLAQLSIEYTSGGEK